MLIYWLFLAFPAAFALAYPVHEQRGWLTLGQQLGLWLLLTLYTLMSLLRYEIGGDWNAYEDMYQQARSATLIGAFSISDPLFSFVTWIGALLGLGQYFANAVCSFILCYGIIRVAARLREPWLGIVTAVPYLMIVVGMGYVRQAAAIGLVLCAIASMERERPLRAGLQLVAAYLFHSTSIVTLPLFAFSFANRNNLRLLIIATAGLFGFYTLASAQLSQFEYGYIEQEYQSGGTLPRLAISLVCSLILLARWRTFQAPARTRTIWLGLAGANIAAFIALAGISSSTVIDRLSLYFSIIQIFVFGNVSELVVRNGRPNILLRIMVIAIAIGVQLIWLVFATHAGSWVPYKSVLTYL